MIVKSNVVVKKRLHIPPSKFSTIQLHKIVKPLLYRALIENYRSPVAYDGPDLTEI